MMRRRRGSIFLEVCMAVVILTAALGVIAQLLVLTAQQQQSHERRRIATRAAANLMERVVARPWQETASEKVASLDLSAEARRRLPDGRVRIEIVDEEGTPTSKRIQIQVDWVNSAGQRVRPVQLAAWKHHQEKQPSP